MAPKKGIFNADLYRDEWGRFATARDATEAAISSTEGTESIRIAGMRALLNDLRETSQRHGDRATHNRLAGIHHNLSEDHEGDAADISMNPGSRQAYRRAARLHREAANHHWQASQRLYSVENLHNPGFDLTDNSQRLIYADWLDDHSHAAAAHHLRVYSS